MTDTKTKTIETAPTETKKLDDEADIYEQDETIPRVDQEITGVDGTEEKKQERTMPRELQEWMI